jgi:hypothetical protein
VAVPSDLRRPACYPSDCTATSSSTAAAKAGARAVTSSGDREAQLRGAYQQLAAAIDGTMLGKFPLSAYGLPVILVFVGVEIMLTLLDTMNAMASGNLISAIPPLAIVASWWSAHRPRDSRLRMGESGVLDLPENRANDRAT